MKKLFIFIITIVVLTGCNSMQKLRVNYTPNSANKHLYYYDKTAIGHNEKVKYSTSENEDKISSVIEIPVKYNSVREDLPKDLPEVLTQELKQVGPYTHCLSCYLSLSKEESSKFYVKLDFFKNKCKSDALVPFLFLPGIPIYLPIYASTCTGVVLGNVYNDNNTITLTNPFIKLNDAKLGLNVYWKAEPENMQLNCDSKSCAVLDSQGRPVNQIIVTENIKVDYKKIKELIIQEKKAKEKQDKEWKERVKTREKECPELYKTLYRAQQGYYIDPIISLETAKRFEELGCVFWLNEKMNGY